MSEVSLLSKLKEILAGLSNKDLDLLAGIGEMKSFRDKDVILKSGSRLRSVFLILEGAARGYLLDSEGNQKTILLRGKGIFVGEAKSLFTDAPQKLEIAAIGSTEVLMLSFADFEKLASENSAIGQLYLKSLKEAILRLTYRVESMIMMSSEERYKDLLKMNPTFLEKSYDKYVANFLGITPVSLSRIKKKLNLEN
jgi:CRP-like cAMP-binding protein